MVLHEGVWFTQTKWLFTLSMLSLINLGYFVKFICRNLRVFHCKFLIQKFCPRTKNIRYDLTSRVFHITYGRWVMVSVLHNFHNKPTRNWAAQSEPMHYRARAIKEGPFRFANLASHFISIQIFQIDLPPILSTSKYFR